MENYSELYDKLKRDGVEEAILFFPDTVNQTGDETYAEITDKQVSNIIPGRYVVSNYGDVFDTEKDRFISQRDSKGYRSCSLVTKDGLIEKKIHRLVLSTFNYRKDFEDLQVNHIDGNPINNALSNLEWSTAKENSDHAMLYGLHKMNGEDNPNNKLTQEQVHEICKLIESCQYYDTEIAKMYGISYATVSDIHKGKIWRAVSRDYDLSKRKSRSLTPEQVHEICKLLEERKLNNHEIGRMFGVAGNTIMQIRNGTIWKDISKEYNISSERIPKKFTDDKIREICEVMQQGKYIDAEIARMFNTSNFFIGSLRKGTIHKDITKDYDMTICKHK